MSPGQVVMGGDSRYRGHGFKSQHRILDGHFSHFTEKNCFQEDRNKRKEALFKLQKNVAFVFAATQRDSTKFQKILIIFSANAKK